MSLLIINFHSCNVYTFVCRTTLFSINSNWYRNLVKQSYIMFYTATFILPIALTV